jgi:hypothetical protein
VLADVEVRVVDPHRPVEAEGDLLELPPELRRQGDAPLDVVEELLEGDRAALGVEDGQAPDVLVPRRRLHRQEQRVGPRESLHVALP